MAEETGEIDHLEIITKMMKAAGARTLAYKRLSPNDNSKNQLYLGGNYAVLQMLPFESVVADQSRTDARRDRFKAKVAFSWLDRAGALHAAPNTQLILYPKYPEVRMSGFLKGADKAPSGRMRSRQEGRVLFMGLTDDRRIIGHVIGPDNPVTRELDHFDGHMSEGVFSFIFRDEGAVDTRAQLLARLREIADTGWLDSCRLDRNGNEMAYAAPNGGGFTLEARLGVIPNGLNEPDFLGWEIKQHNVKDLTKPLSGGAVTLMTPEPGAGIYKSEGVIPFVRQFGYPDTKGRPDRFNFGGVHRYGIPAPRTALTLQLPGFDLDRGQITDVGGGIELISEEGIVAAKWEFSTLLEKWNRKHAKAAYIPSLSRGKGATRQYRYGHTIALGIETDFPKFLTAIASGTVYYDPGIKVERASTARPKSKRRSQFRIKPASLAQLYDRFEIVELGE